MLAVSDVHFSGRDQEFSGLGAINARRPLLNGGLNRSPQHIG
jgi:hypothetical protein